jgi:hypothetical protein
VPNKGGAVRAWSASLAAIGALFVAASCGRPDSPASAASNTAGGLGGESGAHAASAAGGSDAGPLAGEGGHPSAGADDGTGLSAAGSPAAQGGSATGGGGTTSGGSAGADGGGAGADGGSAGSIETGGTGPIDVDLDPGPCGFAVKAGLSEAIGTVGIVEWSAAAGSITQAHLEFGLDTSYGLVAPVDLGAPHLHTLLLGMKASRDYHVRVVAEAGGEHCVSDDFVLRTGPLPDGMPKAMVTTTNAAARQGGYLVTSFLTKTLAFILDADGDMVWWGGGSGIGRAELSFDGKFMWYGNINVQGGAGFIRRVSMDGTQTESFPEFGDCHHDFTVLPDETIAFIQHDGARCDRIMERAPDGTVREVIDVHDAHGGTTMCHTNSIHYHASDDTYTFSDLSQNAYVKITRDAQVVWILGGTTSQFTGDGATWTRQHGHHLLAPDRLLFFNNGPPMGSSTAVEVTLDFDTMTATRAWSFNEPDLASTIYGDVVRLDNGNTLIAYSTDGVLLEVSPEGDEVERTQWPSGSAIGYVMKRASLYGPPPVQ